MIVIIIIHIRTFHLSLLLRHYAMQPQEKQICRSTKVQNVPHPKTTTVLQAQASHAARARHSKSPRLQITNMHFPHLPHIYFIERDEIHEYTVSLVTYMPQPCWLPLLSDPGALLRRFHEEWTVLFTSFYINMNTSKLHGNVNAKSNRPGIVHKPLVWHFVLWSSISSFVFKVTTWDPPHARSGNQGGQALLLHPSWTPANTLDAQESPHWKPGSPLWNTTLAPVASAGAPHNLCNCAAWKTWNILKPVWPVLLVYILFAFALLLWIQFLFLVQCSFAARRIRVNTRRCQLCTVTSKGGELSERRSK